MPPRSLCGFLPAWLRGNFYLCFGSSSSTLMLVTSCCLLLFLFWSLWSVPGWHDGLLLHNWCIFLFPTQPLPLHVLGDAAVPADRFLQPPQPDPLLPEVCCPCRQQCQMQSFLTVLTLLPYRRPLPLCHEPLWKSRFAKVFPSEDASSTLTDRLCQCGKRKHFFLPFCPRVLSSAKAESWGWGYGGFSAHGQALNFLITGVEGLPQARQRAGGWALRMVVQLQTAFFRQQVFLPLPPSSRLYSGGLSL